MFGAQDGLGCPFAVVAGLVAAGAPAMVVVLAGLVAMVPAVVLGVEIR